MYIRSLVSTASLRKSAVFFGLQRKIADREFGFTFPKILTKVVILQLLNIFSNPNFTERKLDFM